MSLAGLALGRRGFLTALFSAPVAMKGVAGVIVEEIADGSLGGVSPSSLIGIRHGDATEASPIKSQAKSVDNLGGSKLVRLFRKKRPSWQIDLWRSTAEYRAHYQGISEEFYNLKSINIHTKRRMQINKNMRLLEREFELITAADDRKRSWYDKVRENFDVPWV